MNNFLKESYVSLLVDKNYKEVNSISLPVGENVYNILTNRLDIIREEEIDELLK